VRDCLLVVDVLTDFAHEDGDVLLQSFRERAPALEKALRDARERGVPVVYANDTHGIWDGDSRALVQRALAGAGGEVLRPLAPADGDAVLVKPRYSAFDLTPLELVLRELEVERILLMGSATEMCVAQTAIDARERGFKVSVLADACVPLDAENAESALRYLEAVTGARVVSGRRQLVTS
jgi:nicotinamidase-related amidase